MILQRLKLYNYGIIKECDITLPLGTTGVLGKFIDTGKSNGSGKSTFLNSVVWILTGKILEGGTLKDILGNYGDSLSGEVWLQINTDVIHVRRTIANGEGGVELFVNGSPRHDGATETNKKIIDIIGANSEILLATSFFQQSEHDTFTNSKKSGPTKRKEYIRKIRGVEIFDACLKDVTEKKGPTKQEIEEYQIKISTIDEESNKILIEDVNALKLQLKSLKKKLEDHTSEKEKFLKLNSQFEGILKDRQKLTTNINNTEESIKSIELEIKNTNASIIAAKTDIINQNNSVIEFEQQISTENSKIEELIEELKQKDISIIYQEDKLNQISVIEIPEEIIKKTHSDYTDSFSQVEIKKSDIQREELHLSNIQNLKTQITCDKCYSIITDEHKQKHIQEKNNVLVKMKNELNNLEAKKNQCKIELDKVEKITSDNNIKQVEKEKIYSKVRTIRREKDILYSNISSHISMVFQAEKGKENSLLNVISQSNSVLTLTNLLTEKHKLLEEYKVNLQTLKNEKHVLDNVKIEDYSSEIEQIEKNISSVNEDIITVASKITVNQSNEKRLYDFKNQKKNYENEIENRMKLLSLYSKLEKIFGKDGISNSFVEETVLKLQELTNKHLWQIDPGKTVIFKTKSKTEKETLDIYILDKTDKRGVRLYERYSGGEKTIINLSIRLALSQLLNERATKKIGFLILDEVFGALCEINGSKVNAILNQIRSQFNQIFVISHTDIRDQFENLIQVTRYNDYSTVEVVR